ncbi:MAG: thiamine-phosphate kinase [Acidobacteriota bacterium]
MAHEEAVLEVVLQGQRPLPPSWLGPGDDACFVPPGALASGLVLSTDALEEELHFRPGWLSPHELGRRLLATALSDLAAMGAEPLGHLVALSWPDDAQDELAELARGLRAAETTWDCPVLGGDTDLGARRRRLSCTVLGRSERPLRRDGGREGDHLFVSGPVGGAARAVAALLDDDAATLTSSAEGRAALDCYVRPEPRLELGARLKSDAHACIDLSDGLLPDLERLARASGLAAVLDLDAVPVHPSVPSERLESLALRGGEDYELLVAGPKELADEHGTLVPIGTLIPGLPGEVTLSGAAS